jgi:hypothetical protein
MTSRKKSAQKSPRPKSARAQGRPVYVVAELPDVPEEQGRYFLVERRERLRSHADAIRARERGRVLGIFNVGEIADLAAGACNARTPLRRNGEHHGFTLKESSDTKDAGRPVAWLRHKDYFQDPLPVAKFYDLDCARRTFAAVRERHGSIFGWDVNEAETWTQHNIYQCCQDDHSQQIFTGIAQAVAALHAEGKAEGIDVKIDAEGLEEYCEPCVFDAAVWLSRHNLTVNQFLAENGIF